jgi:protein-disulfide isomerase
MSSRLRFLMIILVLLIGAWAASAQTRPAVSKDMCLSGKPNAPLRLEVFSDYQCPSCRDFYLETIRPVMKEYGSENKVCVNYFDFPLKMHKHAFEASRYGVASRRLGQDQWLRVSEALYEHQSLWAEDGKIESVVARVLSAEEMAQVKTFLKDPAIDLTVNQEIALAKERQVTMTPTFFLVAKGREQKVAGKISYPVLKDTLDRMLNQMK